MGAPSKYEGEVDLSDRNNSRTLMVEMVGANKRVLEVGCASGYMSKVLTDRGCRVIGVEIDHDAAMQAKEYCEDVVITDIESLELAELFGERRFDVVVFGDVLEHLKDPLSVLRRTRPVLDIGGFVVASMPNIAHGSVRLSLLKGNFDYRELGLLDDTHLRFFTRASIQKLFKEAGLAVVEMRRTTAGIFDVEIALNRAEFPKELVSEMEADPESTTYQFLPKAVLDDGMQAVAELHEREEEQQRRILELERALVEVRQRVSELELETASRHAEIQTLQFELSKSEIENAQFRDRWSLFEQRRIVRIYRRLQKILGRNPPEPPE
jgi:2-polyprenyl-3-methyl-5-hydroxy-6-metoxy-1,4-benzoquinol methylase